MDLPEALMQAIQDEADELGLNTGYVNDKLSEMLARIVTRTNHLMGDEGHGTD